MVVVVVKRLDVHEIDWIDEIDEDEVVLGVQLFLFDEVDEVDDDDFILEIDEIDEIDDEW